MKHVLSLVHCFHEWGFPRRRPKFEGEPDVDVQCCIRCGARRRSIVQFGPVRQAMQATVQEVRP